MTSNDNEVVTPHRAKNGEYLDFRVFLSDCIRNGNATKRGIVIWFDDDDAVLPQYVGMRRQHIAIAGAHLLKDATD